MIIFKHKHCCCDSNKKDELRKRIVQRTEHFFESGVVKEAKLLGEKYGWKHESMSGKYIPNST